MLMLQKQLSSTEFYECNKYMHKNGWKGLFHFIKYYLYFKNNINIVFPASEFAKDEIAMFPQFYIDQCTFADILFQSTIANDLTPRIYLNSYVSTGKNDVNVSANMLPENFTTNSDSDANGVPMLRFVKIDSSKVYKINPINTATVANSLLKLSKAIDTNKEDHRGMQMSELIEKITSDFSAQKPDNSPKISVEIDYVLETQFFSGVLNADETICQIMDKICRKVLCYWEWVAPNKIYIARKE